MKYEIRRRLLTNIIEQHSTANRQQHQHQQRFGDLLLMDTNCDTDALTNPMLGSADPLIGLQQLSPGDQSSGTVGGGHDSWNVTNFSPQNNQQMDMN
jgi:hypothetical protein